jgi:hypothetical protein
MSVSMTVDSSTLTGMSQTALDQLFVRGQVGRVPVGDLSRRLSGCWPGRERSSIRTAAGCATRSRRSGSGPSGPPSTKSRAGSIAANASCWTTPRRRSSRALSGTRSARSRQVASSASSTGASGRSRTFSWCSPPNAPSGEKWGDAVSAGCRRPIARMATESAGRYAGPTVTTSLPPEIVASGVGSGFNRCSGLSPLPGSVPSDCLLRRLPRQGQYLFVSAPSASTWPPSRSRAECCLRIRSFLSN